MSILLPDGAERIIDTLGARGTWIRAGVIALGLLLVILGIVFFLAGNKTVQSTVQSAATAVATKGLVK